MIYFSVGDVHFPVCLAQTAPCISSIFSIWGKCLIYVNLISVNIKWLVRVQSRLWFGFFFTRWERSGCGVWHLPSLPELQTTHQNARSQHEVRLMCLKYVNAVILMSQLQFPVVCSSKRVSFRIVNREVTDTCNIRTKQLQQTCPWAMISLLNAFSSFKYTELFKAKQNMECVIIKSGCDETLINGCSLQTPTLHHHRPSSPSCTRRPF